jgi:predicted metalloprotease
MPGSRRSPEYGLVAGRRVGAVLCAAIGVAAMLAGCSSTVDGHPSGSTPTSNPNTATSAASSAIPPAGASGGPASGTATNAPAGSFLCPGISAAPIVKCLEVSLSEVWSGLLDETITQPTVLAPSPDQVPADCRGGLALDTAFTCTSDLKLYVTSKFLALIANNFVDTDLGYALAALQAHEMGHAVQYAVHQPSVEIKNPTAAQSREFEQQADCLAGVWADQVGKEGGLGPLHFLSVDYELISLISNNPEIRSHGTPAERREAVNRGLVTGRPQDCSLATFH